MTLWNLELPLPRTEHLKRGFFCSGAVLCRENSALKSETVRLPVGFQTEGKSVFFRP